MSEQLVYLLVGLYYVGVGLPALFAQPVTFRSLLHLIYGGVLVALAIFRVSFFR